MVEFETAVPAMRGEMTITISLADADGATPILDRSFRLTAAEHGKAKVRVPFILQCV